MGHNSIRWNISPEEVLELTHNLLIHILQEKNNILTLNELVYLLNCRSKYHKIHRNKKHNCLTKYIRINFGGIKKFIDDYTIYGISNKNNIMYVHLIESELKNFIYKDRITTENDWVLL